MRANQLMWMLVSAAALLMRGVNGRPQAVALGNRPAVQPEPIIIPDEEVMGRAVDEVLEEQKPDEVPDTAGLHPDELVHVEVENAKTGEKVATQVRAADASEAAIKLANAVESGNSTTTAKPVEESDILKIVIPVLLVLLLLIVVGVLIWLHRRHKKKQALKSAGMNAEVKSVTPINTPDGPANVVNLEPVSTGTSDNTTGAAA